jgi:hypothetical protein
MFKDFGVDASYKGNALRVLWDEKDVVEVTDRGKAEIVGKEIAIVCRATDVDGFQIDDRITVDGKNYWIRFPSYDGDAGIVRLFLSASA